MHTYRCEAGHETEALVAEDESDAPTTCLEAVEPGEEELRTRQRGDALPPCGKTLVRVISVSTVKNFPGANQW
jgi:hypothetical protein